MNIMHLKTKVSDSTHSTVGPIEKCTAKIHGVKLDGTNAECCLDKGEWG